MLNVTAKQKDLLIEYREKMEAKCSAFEENKSYEMAFIALWAVPEHFLKQIELWTRQNEQYRLMKQWTEYLENTNDADDTRIKPPKDSNIGSISTKLSRTVPDYTRILRKKYPACKSVLELMHTGEKYRRKRNSIDHSADSLSEDKYFNDYKIIVQSAIEELYSMIEGETNS
jgi:hypothetical protein